LLDFNGGLRTPFWRFEMENVIDALVYLVVVVGFLGLLGPVYKLAATLFPNFFGEVK